MNLAHQSKYKVLAILGYLVTATFQQIKIQVNHPDMIRKQFPDGVQTKVLMWGKHDTMDDLVTYAKIAEPKDGCKPYTNVPQETGPEQQKYAYFVKSGGHCSLSTLIHNAQVAKANALIIQHGTDSLENIEIPDHMSGKLGQEDRYLEVQ